VTGFNKWDPDRPLPERRASKAEMRAWMMRGAWYVSTMMLIVGYVLIFVFWNR